MRDRVKKRAPPADRIISFHDLIDLLCKVLEDMNLDVKKCVGSSTDGSSNMRVQYNGFSAWLNKVSPDQIVSSYIKLYVVILFSCFTREYTEIV